ncbi:MAG: ribonuclease P protein component [Candidatus Paceibacterota bacterium]
MLPKINRADRKQIDQIFKYGKFLNSPNLTFKFIFPQPSLEKERVDLRPTQISFIAPKSVAKLAIRRNLLRRRGYSALSKHIDQFPIGIIGALLFKKPINSVLEIENEIKTILSKIN